MSIRKLARIKPVIRPHKLSFHHPHSLLFKAQTIRALATDAEIKKSFLKSQVVRVSVLEPKANDIITAVRAGDYKTAESIIKKGANINGHNHNENTPLTDAASRGDTKGVEFLLKNKANPSASCDCPHHKTALHYAAENGHVETVKMLLKHNANPNVLDSRRYTAIDVAKTPQVKEVLMVHQTMTGKQIEKDPMKLRMYLPK